MKNIENLNIFMKIQSSTQFPTYETKKGREKIKHKLPKHIENFTRKKIFSLRYVVVLCSKFLLHVNKDNKLYEENIFFHDFFLLNLLIVLLFVFSFR